MLYPIKRSTIVNDTNRLTEKAKNRSELQSAGTSKTISKKQILDTHRIKENVKTYSESYHLATQSHNYMCQTYLEAPLYYQQTDEDNLDEHKQQ